MELWGVGLPAGDRRLVARFPPLVLEDGLARPRWEVGRVTCVERPIADGTAATDAKEVA
jgi:hypothetical protein